MSLTTDMATGSLWIEMERFYPSLALFVCPTRVKITNRDKGTTSTHRLVKVVQCKSEEPTLSIHTVDEDGAINTLSSLSDRCQKVVVRLLMDGLPFSEYCCSDFYSECVGTFDSSKVNHLTDFSYGSDPIDEEKLEAGDRVVLLREKKPVHLAAYLTHGLYLSIFGCGGSLVIAGLAEMKEFYDAADLRLVT